MNSPQSQCQPMVRHVVAGIAESSVGILKGGEERDFFLRVQYLEAGIDDNKDFVMMIRDRISQGV